MAQSGAPLEAPSRKTIRCNQGFCIGEATANTNQPTQATNSANQVSQRALSVYSNTNRIASKYGCLNLPTKSLVGL